ncbi:MAG: c-type cytochrome [Janthinobacterium lividum]
MDGFEFNRILTAILMALLFGMLLTKLSDTLVSPKMLTKAAFPIEVVADAGAAPDPGAQQEAKAEPIEPLLVKASVEHGQEVAKKCLQCHTFDKGGPNRVGPNLWGIVGNKVAHMDSYSYSSVFKAHGGNWTYEELNDYLYHPSKHMPGTKMAFAGVKKTQDRADLIAYLRTLSDAPIALPK